MCPDCPNCQEGGDCVVRNGHFFRRSDSRKIQSLADDPRPSGCKKLSGNTLYRIRQGNFRIVYEVLDKKLVVTVIKVGDRKEIYRAR